MDWTPIVISLLALAGTLATAWFTYQSKKRPTGGEQLTAQGEFQERLQADNEFKAEEIKQLREQSKSLEEANRLQAQKAEACERQVHVLEEEKQEHLAQIAEMKTTIANQQIEIRELKEAVALLTRELAQLKKGA